MSSGCALYTYNVKANRPINMNYSAEKQTKKYSRKIFNTVSQVQDRYAETHQWKNRTIQRFSWTDRIILSTMVLVPVSVTCHMITYQSITWYLSTWKVISYYGEYKNYNIQPPNPIWFVCCAQGRWELIINLQSSTQLCWLSITLLGGKKLRHNIIVLLCNFLGRLFLKCTTKNWVCFHIYSHYNVYFYDAIIGT